MVVNMSAVGQLQMGKMSQPHLSLDPASEKKTSVGGSISLLRQLAPLVFCGIRAQAVPLGNWSVCLLTLNLCRKHKESDWEGDNP